MEAFLQQDEQSLNHNIKGCILPWIHLHGDIRGEYALCCHTDSYFEDGKIIRIGDRTQSPLDVWNGTPMKTSRLKFLSGDYPKECSVCYDKESVGITSHRQLSNREFRRYAKLQDLTKSDGSVPNTPVYLDFRFGNTCNFRCRMCGPDASTSWFKERHLAYGNPTNSPSNDYWTENEEFWNDFEQIIDNIDMIYFAGGEPFVQDGHYKLLVKLIESGKKNVKLRYNSNLSYKKFKQYDLKELWKNFDVKIWPSIDGYGAQVEYSRKGLKWKEFEDNIIYYKSFISSLSITANIYSISSLPQLIAWAKHLKLNFHITNLTFPYELSTTVLPKEAKKKILSSYKKTIKSYSLTEYERSNVVDTLQYMISKDDSHLLPQFKKYTESLDDSRHESFVEVYPEFLSWYKNI